MKKKKEIHMNITTLEYFVSAAELSNFTKAAKKHFVAQTAISQQIAKLEQELNVKLFQRETNRVMLTEAGLIFYHDIKKILQDYTCVVDKITKYQKKEKEFIILVYKEREELQLLTNVMRKFQQQYPHIEIIIKENHIRNVMEEMKHEICDLFVNINCSLTEEDEKNVEQYTIYRGNMMVAVSSDHPKAQRKYLEAGELEEEKFIVLKVDGNDRGIKKMLQHCEMDGYCMQIGHYAANIGAQFMMVKLNKGVAFVQDLMVKSSTEGVKFLPIRNSAHKYEVDLLWSKNSNKEAVHKFIHFVKEYLP